MSAQLQAQLRAYYHYDPEAGVFTRMVTNGRWKEGAVAGSIDVQRGYLQVRWNGRLWYGQRLAWLYVHGVCPEEVDHRDGNPSNNRLSNLRRATRSENLQNMRTPSHNTSGRIGVSFDKRRCKYAAYIHVAGRRRNLGRFNTLEEADRAYRDAKAELHPFQPVQRSGKTISEAAI